MMVSDTTSGTKTYSRRQSKPLDLNHTEWTGKDPSVSVPIDDIELGIENSEVCLAEISTDNPNVWYELGYAIASKREVFLLCSKNERKTHFPFDEPCCTDRDGNGIPPFPKR